MDNLLLLFLYEPGGKSKFRTSKVRIKKGLAMFIAIKKITRYGAWEEGPGKKKKKSRK